MNKIILIIYLFIISCADESNRMSYLQKKYPKDKIEPCTGLIKNSGYQFIKIDSGNQIIAISFYPFSEIKILSFRNIR